MTRPDAACLTGAILGAAFAAAALATPAVWRAGAAAGRAVADWLTERAVVIR